MTATISSALFSQLTNNGWRCPILIKGDIETRYQIAQTLINQQNWRAGFNPDTLNTNNKHLQAYLGQELDYVWLDSSSFFDIDVVCALAGCIQHGGALILTLSPTFIEQDATNISSLPHPYNQASHNYSYYMQRLWQLSQQTAGCVIVDNCELTTNAFPQALEEKFVKPTDLTSAQQTIFNALSKLKKQGHYFIKADRGRGKSTVLAALVKEYLQQGTHITVTAPAKRCLTTVWNWLDKWQCDKDNLTFVAPDELTQVVSSKQNNNSVLIVDEAAALPSQLLRAISQKFNWVIYATTEQGYEGSGKGLSQHFIKQLSMDNELVETFELTKPIRWALKDPLENWLNSICMPNYQPSLSNNQSDKISFKFIQSAELVGNNQLVVEIFGLLSQAHYRTTPNDLKHMLDSPALKLCIGQNSQGQVIAATLLSEEGNLAPALANEVLNGTRRPNGHLTPQIIAAQSGIVEFSQLKGLRVVRIAVAETLRNNNIASNMLEWLSQQASDIDYLASSFAASYPVANFWFKNNFKLARVSTTAEHHSGLFSTLCLKMLSKSNTELNLQIQQGCARQLDFFLPSHYQDVAGHLLWLWYASLAQNSQPTRSYKLGLISGFAQHSTNLYAALPELYNFCLDKSTTIMHIFPIEQQNLLADTILKRQAPSTVAKKYHISGQKQLIKRLRQIITELMQHTGPAQ
ncbi:GNAT family N-acetyltransferase [Catenovulum sp. SX2]|uniref:GNAT family N-acetyltransferase n=1 Tax=Catenovulum sp. SX2 TaxID=3398614 RepID=UPI003F8759B8